MLQRVLALTTLSSLTLFALSAQEYQQQQMQGFSSQKEDFKVYKKSQEEAFAAYQKEQEAAFAAYKKEVGAFWEEPKLSTKKTWVAYSKDKKTRTDVDFENEEIIVETIAANPEEARAKLQVALAKTITIDTQTVQESDPLEQRLAQIKKPEGMVTTKVKPEPILAPVIFDAPPTKKSVANYVSERTAPSNITVTPSTKVKHQNIYQVSVKMPADAMIKKSKQYYDDVQAQAKKRSLPVPLVFAIMHSESSFNPRARSHIPAYGLMQIVPKTAGIDTYHFLYKQKKLVSGEYLYDSTNNITMGTAYLHILYYNYLGAIKDPDARLYCTIAAYNTGAGNIAWAFTRTYNMKKAAPLINKMSAQQVYDKLLADLRFDEPKHYLKNVSKRMAAYHKVYPN
jgi:membrane-bound lytic murein transglycosylase C